MWYDISQTPNIDNTEPYFGEGERSIIVLVKSNSGWIDLARFFIVDNKIEQIVTTNGFTITNKVVKWTYIPNE